MKLHSLMQQFFASRALSTSKRTLENYHYYLDPLDASPLSSYTITEITPEDLEIFLAAQAPRKSITTIRGFHTALVMLCNFALERRYLSASPMQFIRKPRSPRRVPDYFTDSQVRDLLAAVNNRRDRAIILMLLDTGVRRSELLAVDVKDTEFATGFVLIHGKGNKDRYVAIGTQTTAALQEYLLDHPKRGALFRNSRTESRLRKEGLRSMLQRVKARAGLECRANPHKFRHSFARFYLLRGGDLETLRAILGHEDIRLTSRIYAHFLREGIKEKHRQCSPVDFGQWEQEKLWPSP